MRWGVENEGTNFESAFPPFCKLRVGSKKEERKRRKWRKQRGSILRRQHLASPPCLDVSRSDHSAGSITVWWLLVGKTSSHREASVLVLVRNYWERRNFRGRKFSYFFIQERSYIGISCVFSEWPKKVKTRRDDWKACNPSGRNFGMEIVSKFGPLLSIQKLRKFLLLQ